MLIGTSNPNGMADARRQAFASKQVFPNSVIHAINGRVINETPHSDAVIMLAEPGTSIRLELHEEESSFAPMETETEDELGAPLMGEVQVNFSVEPNQPLGIQIVPVTLDPKGTLDLGLIFVHFLTPFASSTHPPTHARAVCRVPGPFLCPWYVAC